MSEIIFNKKSRQDEDYQRFYLVKPDVGFNPDKNKYIVENSIKKYEDRKRRKNKQYIEDLSERTDAVWDYLKHLDRGKSTSIEKYFGKKYLAYLRGQKIMSVLRPDKKGLVLIEGY